VVVITMRNTITKKKMTNHTIIMNLKKLFWRYLWILLLLNYDTCPEKSVKRRPKRKNGVCLKRNDAVNSNATTTTTRGRGHWAL
jgi:hypothetical protein